MKSKYIFLKKIKEENTKLLFLFALILVADKLLLVLKFSHLHGLQTHPLGKKNCIYDISGSTELGYNSGSAI